MKGLHGLVMNPVPILNMYGSANGISVLIEYAQKLLVIAPNTDVSSWARCLNLGLSLRRHPYFASY